MYIVYNYYPCMHRGDLYMYDGMLHACSLFVYLCVLFLFLFVYMYV